MKKRKGFALLKILILIFILGISMFIAVPNVSRYTKKAERKSAYVSVANIVNSIKIRQDGNCFYDFNYENNKETNINELIIFKTDKTYSVYAEMDEKVLISVDNFKNTNKDKEVTWISKNAFKSLDNLTEEALYNINICTNLYDQK